MPRQLDYETYIVASDIPGETRVYIVPEEEPIDPGWRVTERREGGHRGVQDLRVLQPHFQEIDWDKAYSVDWDQEEYPAFRLTRRCPAPASHESHAT